MASICYVVLLSVTLMLVFQQLPCCMGQFFIGRYKTRQDYHLPTHQYPQNINDVDGPAEMPNSNARSLLQKRQFVIPFSPLASRGTIYMAFMFLMPFTVGPKLGRSFAGNIVAMEGVMEREGKSMYNEMGYVDGNLLVRKSLNQWRTNLLAKWRDRLAFKKFKKKNSQ